MESLCCWVQISTHDGHRMHKAEVEIGDSPYAHILHSLVAASQDKRGKKKSRDSPRFQLVQGKVQSVPAAGHAGARKVVRVSWTSVIGGCLVDLSQGHAVERRMYLLRCCGRRCSLDKLMILNDKLLVSLESCKTR